MDGFKDANELQEGIVFKRWQSVVGSGIRHNGVTYAAAPVPTYYPHDGKESWDKSVNDVVVVKAGDDIAAQPIRTGGDNGPSAMNWLVHKGLPAEMAEALIESIKENRWK